MMRRYTRVLLLICIASFFLFILLSLVQLSGYDGGDYDDDGDEKQFYGIHRKSEEVESIDDTIVANRRLLLSTEFRRLSDIIYLYTSTIDMRDGNMNGASHVRILAIVRRQEKPLIHCLFNSSLLPPLSAHYYDMSENHGMRYGTHVISCKIPNDINPTTITNVHIQLASNHASIVTVPINYIIENEQTTTYNWRYRYTICVPLVFGSRYTPAHLIEFFEFNKLFGAEHIFMYIDRASLSPEQMKVIDYYSKDRRELTTIDFQLPIDDDVIWYHGQLLTVNDCLYRNTGLSKWTSFHDLDEYIVPTNVNLPIPDLLDQMIVSSPNGSLVASVRIRAYLFHTTSNDTPPIGMHRVVATIKNFIQYSKCIVRAQMVFEQGIHHTSRVIQHHYLTDEENGTVVRLHHYNDRYNHLYHHTHETNRIDRLPRVYGDNFTINYNRVMQQLGINVG